MLETKIFAVDGGGTKSCGAVFSAEGERLAETVAGPCNPMSDIAGAFASVSQLLGDLCRLAGIGQSDLKHHILSLASAGLVEDGIRSDFATKLPFAGNVILMTDGYAALIGAGGGKSCGLIVVGTGSVGHRLLPDGTSLQIGGWGWLGGDQGSGSWIGKQALEASLLSRDGIISSSRLTDLVNNRIGLGSSDALRWLSEAHAADFAGLAPLVFGASQDDDPRAVGILDSAAQHIADLSQALHLSPDQPLYVVGSVGERLKAIVARKIDRVIQAPQNDALKGAFLVASGAAPKESIL